jgi:acyl carrier protein
MRDNRHGSQSLESVGETRRLELEIKQLILEVAKLRDLDPEQIDERLPLVQSLGLDSLDALQIAAALSRRYGVVLEADRLSTETASLRSIIAMVLAGQARR